MATGNLAAPTEFPQRIGKVAARALALYGFTRYDQLTLVTPTELLEIHGIGYKAIRILDESSGPEVCRSPPRSRRGSWSRTTHRARPTGASVRP